MSTQNKLLIRRSKVRFLHGPLRKPQQNTGFPKTREPNTFVRYTTKYTISAVILAIFAWFLALSTPAIAHDTGTYWHAKHHIQGYQRRNKSLRLGIRHLRGRLAAMGQSGGATPLQRRIRPWVRLARCESGNRWDYNGSSGFHGGLQFHPQTWRSYGGRLFAPYAYQATPIQQVAIAQLVLNSQGRGAWPHCSRIGAW